MVNALFSDELVRVMLDLVVALNIFIKIDGRRKRNTAVYNQLADAVNEHCKLEGDAKLSERQINTKWKTLKSTYKEERIKSSKSGGTPSTWRFYEKMHDVMGHRPIVNDVSEELAAMDKKERSREELQEQPKTSGSGDADTDRPPRTLSANTSDSEPSTSRKRKHSSDFENFLKGLCEERSKEMNDYIEMMAKQRGESLSNITSMFSQAIKACCPQPTAAATLGTSQLYALPTYPPLLSQPSDSPVSPSSTMAIANYAISTATTIFSITRPIICNHHHSNQHDHL
ncbi:uncharacterized protein [Watersipora subatra]|uniref:uncharacterized protein n=1 Tax=Watersipora subatra TaxID=2589382 RepID=UPI00355B65FB